MTTPHPAIPTPARTRLACRAASVAVAAILAGGLLAGCGSGAETDCSLTECTITFPRDEQGNARVLGMSVELVSATDSTATLSVAGQEVTIGHDASREVAGFTVSVQRITDDEVVVKVAR